MASKDGEPRKDATPQYIVGQIKQHLGERKKATFTAEKNRMVTLSTRKSIIYPTGREYHVTIHNRIPDRNLYSSTGAVIITFPRLIFFTPKPRASEENLKSHTRKHWRFVEWRGGEDNADPTLDKIDYNWKPELTEYADVLNLQLEQIEKVDHELSERVRTRAETLFLLAVAQESSRRREDDPEVNPDDFVADFKIGETEARIRYRSGKRDLRKPNYIIDFRQEENTSWVTYTFNRRNILVAYENIADGKKRFDVASSDQASKLAKILNQFDENDIER